MSDELDALKAALRTAPVPDSAAKAAALRLAMDNFDRLQASTDALRPKEDHPARVGFLQRTKAMLTAVRTKPVLAATTSVAALLVGFVVILPLVGHGPLPQAQKPVVSEAPEALIATPEAAKPLAPAKDKAVVLQDTAPALKAAPAARATLGEEAPAGIVADMPAPMPEPMVQPVPNTEAFANADANPVKVTAEAPVSTFSIDVDTASYAVVRSSLNAGNLPDPAAVRIEEMVNYFPYAYPAPPQGQAFRPTITVMPTPWNPNTRLVNIAIQGALPDVATRPPLNLVFLVDTSGSMEDANKLPLLKQSLALLLAQLRPEDQVALVAYAGAAGEVLPPTSAAEHAKILAALDQLAHRLVDAAMDGIITVDADQRILMFNRSAEKIFGWTAAEALGKRLEFLMPERFRRGARLLRFTIELSVADRDADARGDRRARPEKPAPRAFRAPPRRPTDPVSP